MIAVERLQDVVDRRIGGLEKDPLAAIYNLFVDRRIGGLEI